MSSNCRSVNEATHAIVQSRAGETKILFFLSYLLSDAFTLFLHKVSLIRVGTMLWHKCHGGTLNKNICSFKCIFMLLCLYKGDTFKVQSPHQMHRRKEVNEKSAIKRFNLWWSYWRRPLSLSLLSNASPSIQRGRARECRVMIQLVSSFAVRCIYTCCYSFRLHLRSLCLCLLLSAPLSTVHAWPPKGTRRSGAGEERYAAMWCSVWWVRSTRVETSETFACGKEEESRGSSRERGGEKGVFNHFWLIYLCLLSLSYRTTLRLSFSDQASTETVTLVRVKLEKALLLKSIKYSASRPIQVSLQLNHVDRYAKYIFKDIKVTSKFTAT